ncbi:hypothetical protein BH11PLA2_BH11PLA2_15930 [soil metagenome]
MSNAEIVARLRAEATEQVRSGGNLYRIRALRQAAFAVSGLEGEVSQLGPEALRLAGLGKHLTNRVMQWATGAVKNSTPMLR